MIHFRIKELCKERGILLQDLAETVGLSRVSLTRIIQNQQNPTLDALEKLANALHVEVGELFTPAAPVIHCPKCGAKLMLVEYVEEPLTLAKPPKEAGEEKESKE